MLLLPVNQSPAACVALPVLPGDAHKERLQGARSINRLHQAGRQKGAVDQVGHAPALLAAKCMHTGWKGTQRGHR